MATLAALKRATAAAHLRTEAALPPLDELATWPTYRRVVQCFHAFHARWEPTVWASEEVTALFDDESSVRRKLPLLERDLRALQLEPLAVDEVPEPTLSALESVGALYVLEGSTLGGQVIMRHVQRHLPLGPESGGSYFRGYGERTGTMWRSFGARIDAAHGDDRHDEMIRGALACFAAIESWFRRRGRVAASEIGSLGHA